MKRLCWICPGCLEMLKDVYFPQTYLTPFPEPGAVFAEPVSKYTKHLHPLASIDLSIIDAAWSGKIHMLAPMEPCDGCIGDSAEDFYTDYLNYNWLGFKLSAEHRYELCGDFKYFMVERPEGPEPFPGARDELEEFYTEERKKFDAARANFLNRQELNSIHHRDLTPKPNITFSALQQIGGGVTSGALSYGQGIALDESDPGDVVPLTPDGTRFRFIASVPAWHYGLSGAEIFLFFEPSNRIALFAYHYD